MQRKSDPVLIEIIRTRIRLKMEELGISQAQLADEAGVSRSRLNELLRKDRLPGCDFLIVIAERLGVSIDYLLGKDREISAVSLPVKRLLAAFAALDLVQKERVLANIEETARGGRDIDTVTKKEFT